MLTLKQYGLTFDPWQMKPRKLRTSIDTYDPTHGLLDMDIIENFTYYNYDPEHERHMTKDQGGKHYENQLRYKHQDRMKLRGQKQ